MTTIFFINKDNFENTNDKESYIVSEEDIADEMKYKLKSFIYVTILEMNQHLLNNNSILRNKNKKLLSLHLSQ